MKYLLSIFRHSGRSLWRLIDNPKGESRCHACMDMTEPKGWGFAPSSQVLNKTAPCIPAGAFFVTLCSKSRIERPINPYLYVLYGYFCKLFECFLTFLPFLIYI